MAFSVWLGLSHHRSVEDVREDGRTDHYLIIAVLMFAIGLVGAYLVMTTYYSRRFIVIAKECERMDSIVPLITEIERES